MFKKCMTGFHITFPNGWTASVQWGPGNYCDNYDESWDKFQDESLASGTAEVAAWHSSAPGDLVESTPFYSHGVGEYMEPLDVLEFINWVSSRRLSDLDDGR